MNKVANLMPQNTLQLMSIQYELLMSVGLDLKLETMLHIFMQNCLKRLGLRSIHVYSFLKHTDDPDELIHSVDFVEHFRSIPQHSGFYPHNYSDVYASIKQFYQEEIESPVTIQSNGTFYIIFHIREFGILVLDKQQLPEHLSIADAVSPIVERLAVACHRCIEHVNLASEIEARLFAEKACELSTKQDPLTNLSNRQIFHQRLFQEITRSLHHNEYGAVLFIDLDHFNKINDSLGHTTGDALLTEVAHRLRLQARAEDNLFRIGGDEFVVLLNHIGSTKKEANYIAQDVAQRLCEQISKPVLTKEQTLHITASIGIVLFTDKGLNESDIALYSEEIVQNADIALFRAKEQGRNRFELYRESMQKEAKRYHAIATQLRDAIDNDEITLVYQPLVNCNEEIIGAEALLRWNNPVLGKITPDEFIPIAEESGQIIKIGEWVLQSVCSLVKEIHSATCSSLQYITVNISQKQFNHSKFVSNVKQTITQSGISPEFIRLEITESLLISNIESIILKMNNLSKFGVKFLLDDFGTGYSSLSNIQHLPINSIKIDKTFITNINLKNDENMALTKAIVSLTDHINLDCIAEGVETEEDAEFCKSNTIYAMQGYYYYHPLLKNDFMETLINDSENLKQA